MSLNILQLRAHVFFHWQVFYAVIKVRIFFYYVFLANNINWVIKESILTLDVLRCPLVGNPVVVVGALSHEHSKAMS